MGGGVLQDGPLTLGEGGEVDGLEHVNLLRNMRSHHVFATLAHSSSGGTTLHKKLLCQYLCLGLPGVLTKQLCPGTNIEWGRRCKGDDLDEGLSMTIL